eukprot:767994-Hanusia_phi.AAC.4
MPKAWQGMLQEYKMRPWKFGEEKGGRGGNGGDGKGRRERNAEWRKEHLKATAKGWKKKGRGMQS